MMMVLILNERRTFISILEKVGVDLRSQKNKALMLNAASVSTTGVVFPLIPGSFLWKVFH